MKAIALSLIILGVAFVVIGPIVWNNGNQLADTENRKETGQLIPFDINSSQLVELQFGGIHVETSLEQLSQGFNLSHYVYLGFDYPFQVEFKDDRILVSAVIRNAEGEKVATITENAWAVSNNRVIAYERNYNAYAFEVIDSNLVPVIQIEFFPNNKMYLGGFFYIPNSTLLLTDDSMIGSPSPENISYARAHTLFNYPSEQHLMEMAEKPSYPVVRTSAQVIVAGEIITFLGIAFSATTASAEYLRKERARSKLLGWKTRMKKVFRNASSRAFSENKKKKMRPDEEQFEKEVISYAEDIALAEKGDIAMKQGTIKAEEFYNCFKQVKSRLGKGEDGKKIENIILRWYDKLEKETELET